MQAIKLMIFLCGAFSVAHSYIVEPGPVVKATKGAVWPKPVEIVTQEDYLVVKSLDFDFAITGETCSILDEAVQRYWKIILSLEKHGRAIRNITVPNDKAKRLRLLNVELENGCANNEFPSVDMNEMYELKINSTPEESYLRAQTVWGILRGLETFSQLIHLNNDYNVVINVTHVKDYPRFSHRGILLDTSRHFMPLYIIFQVLEAMSYNKMNVFHWHITDDHSFPYQSIRFPELSDKGAYHPVLKVYTQDDIKRVIEFARIRGIRVMPEFDTPGHTRSWGQGVKDILTPCYEQNKPSGQYGPMDPSQDALYDFLKEFMAEVVDVFPDPYVHLGGDEVEFECWGSNPNLNEFMKKMNISEDYVALESLYIQKLLNLVKDLHAKTIVWEEVYMNGVVIPNDTVVHVWKDDGYKVLDKVTKANKPALLSACWYLDHLQTGGDWTKYYMCDPYKYINGPDQRALIKGGEACMWAESVNEYNVVQRMWPRASAAAEKLWSTMDADTMEGASRRLEEHTCRMNQRGIPAQPPNGPGFCL